MKFTISCISFGVITFLSWNFYGLFIIVAFALYFHIIFTSIHQKLLLFFLKSFVITLIFNVAITFWLMSINILEALLIFSVNSLLMTIPPLITFMFYRLKPSYTYIYFIASWFIFELIHSNWSFSWPWLILGNSLGNTYYLIQWYSYLGVYSGTL